LLIFSCTCTVGSSLVVGVGGRRQNAEAVFARAAAIVGRFGEAPPTLQGSVRTVGMRHEWRVNSG
jgi:hypothetical protein